MRHHTRWVLCCALGFLTAWGGPRDDDSAGPPAARDSESKIKTKSTTPAADLGPPQRGDWLVQHMLSDPESLNPYTSNDSGASVVLEGSVWRRASVSLSVVSIA